MNDLNDLIVSIVKMNKDNNIYLSPKSVYENKEVNEIMCNYKIDKNSMEKIYIFSIELIKFNNKNILKHIKKLDSNISNLFFKYIVKTQVGNVVNFSALFLKFYMFNKLSVEELEKCFSLIVQLDNYYFLGIWEYKMYDSRCYNERYGKILKENGFAEDIFQIGDVKYKLNAIGKKFFDNSFLDLTPKEKLFYSKIINLKVMQTIMTAKEHKEYYKSIIIKCSENEAYIKILREHEGLYKDLLEEYDVLIKYAIAKYGENCRIKFCGQDTRKRIKCDGIIIYKDVKEKIEITYPFYDKEKNNEMKQLNRVGHSPVKTIDTNSYKTEIKDKIETKINDKNDSDSYDESIILVVMMNMFDFLFDSEAGNPQYYDDLLGYLKKREYKFKNVDILIDKYGKDSEPWIYRIK